jgi:ADP-ribose pyrophosphatase YjhB (NUDIX family)
MALDTDSDNLGLTTRTELGMLVESRKNLICYAPPGGFKVNYQMELCRLKGIPVCETLEQVIEETKKIILKVPQVVAGLFNSTEITANDCDPVVLREVIETAEANNAKGSIWCFLGIEDVLNLRLLHNLNYIFHHYNPDTKSFAWYKWNNSTNPDAVPEYATAIGGACAMILNEDESKVLFVYEESYGKKWWKFVSGSVDVQETAIECLLRELVEEIGLKLENIPVKLVSGYNQKSARYGRINDYFYTFVVNIPETNKVKADGVEVLKTQWLPVDKVLSGEVKELDGIGLNQFNVESLRKYVVEKRFLPCRLEGNKMLF